MRLFPFRRVFGRAWWGVFGLLIAVPALALSWLGLRAVRAERLEAEEQLLQQQAQISQLADAALLNTLTRIEGALRRLDARSGVTANVAALPPGVRVLRFDRSGLVTFPDDRVYFGPFGRYPAERVRLTARTTMSPNHFPCVSSSRASRSDYAGVKPAKCRPCTCSATCRLI